LFLYGRGANGKTTFIETIAALMGELGHKARAAALMAEAAERIPNEIAALAGKRFVVASELADGGRLNEGLVKDLTGNDAISARFLYGESFTFRPSFVLWLYGNHRPVIVGTDDGIWRRVHLIPFNVQIPPAERDPALPAKLRAELPGILAWAMRGWRDYQANGLGAPETVTAATADYRAEADILGHFLAERCVVGPKTSARAGKLYAEYAQWAETSGLRALSSVKFAAALAERGFTKPPRSNRGNVWQGVGLMATAEDEGG
jgi:putative DNA primase/helicase